MRSEITRLMVEVAVGQGLRDLRSQSHRRALRKMVEYGGRYSRGPFQRRLFSTLQDMLHSDEHPYYELASRVAQQVDEKYLLSFCINMGFESWTRGAKTIRRLEEQTGCNVPWTIVIHLSEKGGAEMPLDTASQLIDQGMAMGVYSYMIFDPLLRLSALRTLCDLYPKCALMAFLPDEGLDEGALNELEGTDNLMLVAMRRGGAFLSPAALQAHRRLYGLCTIYGAEDVARLADSRDLRCPGDPDCVLPFFLPAPGCPGDVRTRFNEMLLTLKDHPEQPLFPVDLSMDLQRIDSIISTDACALSLGAEGEFRVGNPGEPTGIRFPEKSLADVVMACLRKQA